MFEVFNQKGEVVARANNYKQCVTHIRYYNLRNEKNPSKDFLRIRFGVKA